MTGQGAGLVVGYAYFGEDAPRFEAARAPLQSLTHLMVSFAPVSPQGLPSWTPTVNVRDLKARFPDLQVLLAVGGWTGSQHFSDAAATLASRRSFAEAARDLVETHGFDGIDIDWEYPVVGGLPENRRRPEDRTHFTLLLAELRRGLDPLARTRGRPVWLTAAVGAGRAQIEALETERYQDSLDWLNLMTYDFHGSWNPVPGDNSSLADTETAVQLHLERGFPAAKIVVGTPLYAHQWVRSPGGPWQAGPVLLWNEAEALRRPQNFVWDPRRGASRLEEPGRIVTWDSEEALEAKKALVQRLGLGGLMTWQVSGDPQGLQLARMAALRR